MFYRLPSIGILFKRSLGVMIICLSIGTIIIMFIATLLHCLSNSVVVTILIEVEQPSEVSCWLNVDIFVDDNLNEVIVYIVINMIDTTSNDVTYLIKRSCRGNGEGVDYHYTHCNNQLQWN